MIRIIQRSPMTRPRLFPVVLLKRAGYRLILLITFDSNSDREYPGPGA